jgi:dTDP-4-amino-4,6-dideoxygalactose transaminase
VSAARPDIHVFAPVYPVDEVLAEIRATLESGWTGLGGRTVEFEKEWAGYTGVPHVVYTNSCTAALHLALRTLATERKWSAGDEVITSPITFVSTPHAVRRAGYFVPVFADIDCYGCLDPDSLEKAITTRTRAVVFIGHGGSTGRLGAIKRICSERKLDLVVDAAHMAGTRYRDGSSVYDRVSAVCWSFQSVKNLPTADSGAVGFFDETLEARARRASWLGIDKDTFRRTQAGGAYRWRYNVVEVGDKLHGNALMAAVALVGLRHLDRGNAYRRQIAAWYDALLPPEMERVRVPEECSSSRHFVQVLVEKRDLVIEALNAQGIFPGVHYQSCTTFDPYEGSQACPMAERFAERVLTLPCHLNLSYADVVRVCSALATAV